MLPRGTKMSRTSDELEAENARLRATVRAYEEQLSEVVTPELEGEEWVDVQADGTDIPIMRGSPRLPAYITFLHLCINRPELIHERRRTHS